MDNSKNSNVVQYVLIGLLVVAAFFIGSLWTRVNNMEGSDVKANPNQPAANLNGNVPEAEPTVDIKALIKETGINESEYEKCLVSSEAADIVKAQEKSGSDVGITGTPGGFIIDTKTMQGVQVPGAVPYTMLKTSLEKVMAGTDLEDLSALVPITDRDHVRGDTNAQYALIEYSDYDCPFCKRFHPTAKQLLSENEGKVKWVYRQMPLDQLHPQARSKSISAVCAGIVGGSDVYWKFTDAYLQ